MDEFNISLRQFYQIFGTNIMQNDIYKYFPKMEEKIEKKTFWVDNIFKKIKQMQLDGKDNFVLSDVRFLHEAERIYKEGGILIKITKDNIPSINKKDSHISENSICDIPKEYITYNINNNSTIKDLYNKINEIINKIN